MHPKSKRAAAQLRQSNRRYIDLVASWDDAMQETVLASLQEKLKASRVMKRGIIHQLEMLQKAAAREVAPERAKRLKRYCARLAEILEERGTDTTGQRLNSDG